MQPEPVAETVGGHPPILDADPVIAATPASNRAPVCDPGLAGIDMSVSVPAPEEPSDTPVEDEDIMKWGFVPLYRAFQEESWWTEKPWDRAHFILDLYMRAQRKPGRSRIGSIARGEVATSYTAMAQRSGRDVKTATRWCDDFQELGEIKVENMGRNGIVVRICKYETYALGSRSDGMNDGRKGGGMKGGKRG